MFSVQLDPCRRSPKVLTTVEEVSGAVEQLLRCDSFVFDVETEERSTDRPDPRTNQVLWIGFAAQGQTHLIPMGHPKGLLIEPAGKIKKPAWDVYGMDDPRSFTEGTRTLPKDQRKLSHRRVEVPRPAVYGPPPEQLDAAVVFALLHPLFFSDRAKIGHNVKFDLQSIAKYYDEIPPGPYHDTILVRHVLSEDLTSYDLKELVLRWFNIPHLERASFYPKLGKQGVQNFGLDEAARYLAKDVRYCWLMFQKFYPLLKRRGVQAVYDFEMSVYPIIMLMEHRGFAVDLSRLEVAKQEIEEQIQTAEHQAWLLAGDQFSLSDPDAKRWVLFGEARTHEQTGQRIPEYGASRRQLKSQKLRVLSRTPEKKQPAVTAAVLDVYVEQGNQMATVLSEWAKLEKLRGTFIVGINSYLNEGQFGYPTIHTSYRQHGTVTGRLSAASPNLQQLPRGSTIRDLFVAPPGKILIVADYDQVELRCAGYLSHDPNMTETFIRGDDVHRQAAAAMYHVSFDQVTSAQRSVGKTQNFAVLYGAGVGKIAAVAGCSQEEASKLIDRYYQQFSGLEPWKRRELQAARKRGDRANPLLEPPRVVIPPNGRLRRLPDLFSEEWKRHRAERQAINAIVQGFASNITKMAMIELDHVLPENAWMLAQVHDEIIVMVDEPDADEVMDLVVQTMGAIREPNTGDPILGEIPLVASAATGTSWAQAKK